MANSCFTLFKADSFFPLGLASTLVLDEVGVLYKAEKGLEFQVLMFAISMIVILIFAVIGYYGTNRKREAIDLGLILYILDTLLVIFLQIFLGLLLHVLAIVIIFRGYKSLNKLEQMETEQNRIASVN